MTGENTAAESDGGLAEQSVGVTVPDDYVAAFVAEAFEDPERSTTWDEVVDEAVADESRAAWEELSMSEQVREMLEMADEFDGRAVDRLNAIPADRTESTNRIDKLFEEAKRCRRNADRLRDGIAHAYADGRVDDAELVDAVEGYGYETDTVAKRERLLETVTETYDYDFRPYGGTLMDDGEEEQRTHDHW
jgi:hypothetical protein